ncbi:MAG: hypothetical protein ABIN83_01250 [Sphingomicrobium sp.]
MIKFIHHPARWDKQADLYWSLGQAEQAVAASRATLDGMIDPDADAFIQPAFYLFQCERYADGAEILERGRAKFPDHPMILLSLGGSYVRSGEFARGLIPLNRFLECGYSDMAAFDALAHAHCELGDRILARSFGTLALDSKDRASADRHGQLPLNLAVDPAGKARIIAFTLFGSNPRYLRGALQNVVVARELYPGWTCRLYVDDSVDADFRNVIAAEGAEVILDESGNRDLRHLLCRRFLVADDAEVGHFMVRDCDSVVSAREAAAVAEWLDSGLPFHTMRDWYTHTDPMLAGMWGGTAGVYPNMGKTIEKFIASAPRSTNWDQYFLREQVWPAIRDHCCVHDRYFSSHGARPFPTPTPPGREHVGQNEYVADRGGQADAIAPFFDRIPALNGKPRTITVPLDQLFSKLAGPSDLP